jgi:hypothetical protein
VSDINVSIVLGLLGTMLPDVWTENSSGGRIYDVSTCVEADQSVSSFFVDLSLDLLANHSSWVDFFAQIMQETLSDLLNVVDIDDLTVKHYCSDIIDLTS